MPSGVPVPPPPDFTVLTPTVEPWPAGQPFVRVFNHTCAPTAFNPGTGVADPRGRFHFFTDLAGRVVPILYGGRPEEVALAETVFHDVPVQGLGRTVQASSLASLSITTLRATRDLRLVELHGWGLRRLEVMPEQLTATGSATYAETGAWARALHAALPHIDGLLWMSRQFNSGEALVLFGDRVDERDLEIVESPLPLRLGPGRQKVDRAANLAGIAVV
jgi:hypothetical protein